LGRGLDALLGSEPSASAAAVAGPPSALPIDRLEPNRYQPRSHFDSTGLDDLAESIRSQGVVQPIVVTPKHASPGEPPPGEDERYVIIAGERRWRAARRAGLAVVPVVVREIENDRQMLEMALVENVQRADLNPIEEAEAYRTLGDTFELSQEDIASRVGKGRTTVTNALRLLRLPEEIQDFLREGRLTAGQARPLLAIPETKRQVELAERAVQEGLTARDLEALTAGPGPRDGKARKRSQEVDVHTRAAMEKLTHALQTRVEIARRRRGGQIRIHFHSEDELIRLYDRLTQGKD
jgi:ParB family chromosome partitioning protein